MKGSPTSDSAKVWTKDTKHLSNLLSIALVHEIIVPCHTELMIRQERKRQASLKGNLEEARAWQRLTFPFPFVHHQSREEIHYPVQILVLRDDG